CRGHGSSPASCVDSVRSPRKSCQYDPWWACTGWMLASDLSDGSSGLTRTYRMHAHRPMESTCQPSRRIGENPPYGMIGRVEKTTASFEARVRASTLPTAGGAQ